MAQGPQRALSLTQIWRRAEICYRQRRLVEAEHLCQQILSAKPDHCDALHLLGVIKLQQGSNDDGVNLLNAALRVQPNSEAFYNLGVGLACLKRFQEAIASYGRALTINPVSPRVLNNCGVAFGALDRHAEAVASYDRALAIAPDFAEAWSNLGASLAKLDQHEKAVESYRKALGIRPTYTEAAFNRGNALEKLQHHEEALSSYDHALGISASYFDALCNRSKVLAELNRHEEAFTSLKRALAIRPDNAKAHNNHGNVLQELKRPAAALASYDNALALKPDYADALNNRGNALQQLKRPAAALASYDNALAVTPDYADALNNRGNALQQLKRPAAALASYDNALAVKPDYADALNNRGNALRGLNRPTEALASYGKGLAINPDDAEAHVNRSCLRLLLGDFDGGWKEYEWRRKMQDSTRKRRDLAQPLWLGEQALEGRAVLLHAEQGFGDAVQFVRYVPLVAARAAKVILEVQPPLKALLSGIRGASLTIGRGENVPAHDFHCPLLSLPLAFKTRLKTIPATIPYLSASEDRVNKWNERLPKSGMRRIGIAWAGNPTFNGDQTRSIGLTRFLPLLSVKGVKLISIQKDLRPGDCDILQNNSHVMHLGNVIEDFSDTAAIISLLDLIISSDTSIVHLAGALGKPVWILLQYAADWRWLLDRDNSPWYPTARLFRQPEIGDWETVLQKIHDELTQKKPPGDNRRTG